MVWLCDYRLPSVLGQISVSKFLQLCRDIEILYPGNCIWHIQICLANCLQIFGLLCFGIN